MGNRVKLISLITFDLVKDTSDPSSETTKLGGDIVTNLDFTLVLSTSDWEASDLSSRATELVTNQHFITIVLATFSRVIIELQTSEAIELGGGIVTKSILVTDIAGALTNNTD